MPIHNWKSVESGIFHGFHQVWSTRIIESLNRVLPSDHYAIVEQNATLSDAFDSQSGGVALAAPPQTARRVRADLDRAPGGRLVEVGDGCGRGAS